LNKHNKNMNNYIWYGLFTTFEEAAIEAERLNQTLADTTNDGFNSKIWQEKQIIMYQEALEGVYKRNTNIESALEDSKVESIIDFGGGSGWIHAFLQNKPHLKHIEYFNLEIPSTKAAFEQVIKTGNLYKWLDFDDSESNFGINMIYSNSAIQYLSNNKVLIDLVQRYQPTVILLDDVFESADQDLYSLQNYYKFYQVNRFISVNLLADQIQKMGYQLLEKIPYVNNYSEKMISEILLPDGTTLAKPSTVSLKFVKK